MAKQPSARAQMLHDLCEQQAALRRSLALAELLKTIAVAANQATTVEDIYRCTLEQVCQQMGWPVGHVYVASPDESDGLTTSGIWYLGDAERFDVLRRTSETSRFAPGIGLPGRVLAEGRPVWIPDVLEDGNFSRGWAGEALGIRAGFAFPVQVSTDVVSVLEFFSPEVLPPDEQMLEVVGQVGALVGRAVEHARTDAALRRAYDELWQANSDLMREVGERTRAEAKLSHLAFYDTLTGLPNRALFLDRLNHALTRSDRSHRGMGVMFLDLDNFKTVNDTLGHDFGDDLLKLVAARLRTAIRAGDTVARFGGDEFTILLESLNDRADAVTVAQRIVEIIREPAELGTTEFVPSFSIGIAFGVSGRDQSDVLLRHADLAMYRAKTSGKGCFEVFDPSMTTSAKERLEMEVDLRRALERHELRVHYQPIVSLKTGKIVAMEALTRWEHSERGMVDPSQFIPVAEETGLIVPLGQWVLGEACRQIKRWQIVNPEAGQLMVAINLAARQFQHPNLVQEIEAILRETGLDPACLQLEVSETAVMKDVEATIRRLNALKALGVKLAIDDCGTGYSSLAYLRQFPVDTLKIDRSFVGGLGREVHDSEVVRSVVTMAKNLSLAITSEGIETVEQLSQLVALGCDRAQGYYFSAAVRPESLTASLWHEVEGRLFSTPRGKANVA